jgi:hypothetical protein
LFALRAQADRMSALHQSPESMISGYSNEITRKYDDKIEQRRYLHAEIQTGLKEMNR